jgi:hypothetical protein
MGFRTPLTSAAESLDTTGGFWGALPGVRTVTDQPAQASVELQSGYLEVPASVTASGGGTSGGGVYLSGGRNLGVVAPGLALGTDPNPAGFGNPVPAARLDNAQTLNLGGARLTGSPGDVDLTSFTPNSPTAAGTQGCTYRARTGWARVSWDVAYNGGPFSRGFLVNTLPAGLRPQKRLFYDLYFYGGQLGGLYVDPSGQCVIDLGTSVAVGGFVCTAIFDLP